MKKRSIKPLISGLPVLGMVMGFSVVAQSSEVNEKDIAEINQEVVAQPSSGQMVRQQISAWFSQKNIIPKSPSKTNKIYYPATAVVMVNPEDKNYPKALQQAFDKAFDKARASFVFDRVGNQFSDKVVEVFENGGSNSREFSPEMCHVSELESIWQKIVALTGAELDQALVENGIDPQEYKATPKTGQKELYYEKSIEKNVRTASGELIGLLPTQTFIANNENGTTTVGVIMMYSPKLVALAADLRNGVLPTLSSKSGGKPISYFVSQPAEDLANLFGPRLVFDEQNRPLVLAYGQWASSYHGNNERQRERSTTLAYEKADMQATQLIGEFINGTLESKSEQISGSITRHYLESDCKEQREKEEEAIIDEVSKYMRITGQAQMKGSAGVREWSMVNEFGVETVGVVRAFSYDLVEAHSLPKTSKPQHNAGVRASKEEVDPEEEW